jgi:hypothetical protein
VIVLEKEMQPGTPGLLVGKYVVSPVSDKLTKDGISPLGLSHTGRTFRATFPIIEQRGGVIPKLGHPGRRRHYDIKTDFRLTRETSEELDRIAEYIRRSKSEVIRMYVEDGVKSTKMDRGYKRYLKKLEKDEETKSRNNPDDFLFRHT